MTRLFTGRSEIGGTGETDFMAKIAYALAGEGRGHATRSRTVADGLLERGHSILFLTGDDGCDFLSEAYREHPGVDLIRIPVLRFAYKGRGPLKKVSAAKTLSNSLKFAMHMREESRRAVEALKHLNFEPDLVITDFEPLAWRIARRLRKPLISLDNQHFFRYARLDRLPARLWRLNLLIGLICQIIAPSKRATLISKFVPDDYIKPKSDRHMIGPLIRPEIRRSYESVEPDDFILCYLRPSVAEHVLPAIVQSGKRAVVYGLGEKPDDGNVSFRAVSSAGFARDMYCCERMVTSAGNQSIGECLYLRKPFLLIPEPGQMEQEINACLASQLGAQVAKGDFGESFREFLESDERPKYPFTGDAVEKAVQIIDEIIAEGSRKR